MWNKIETLEQFLDPNFIITMSSQSSKEDLLLGCMTQVEAVKEQGDELIRLKDYVNTTEFQGLEGHEKKLGVVASTHNQQERAMEEIARKAQELVKVYNQVLLQLSAECVEWGEQVARLESQKNLNSQN